MLYFESILRNAYCRENKQLNVLMLLGTNIFLLKEESQFKISRRGLRAEQHSDKGFFLTYLVNNMI